MQDVDPRVINLRATEHPLILLCRILTMLSPFNKQMYANGEFHPDPTTKEVSPWAIAFENPTSGFPWGTRPNLPWAPIGIRDMFVYLAKIKPFDAGIWHTYYIVYLIDIAKDWSESHSTFLSCPPVRS